MGPAIEVCRKDYMARLAQEAVKPMDGRPLASVVSLSFGLRVLAVVEEQMQSLIAAGEIAKQEHDRAGALARMTPEARKWATY